MSRRNRRAGLVVIYWRDIPAQVRAPSRASRGTADAKVLLDARFQHAIDRAAAVAGKTDIDGYVGEWRRLEEPLTDNTGEASDTFIAQAVAARAAQLEADHPKELLEALVRSGGWHPDSASQPRGEP